MGFLFIFGAALGVIFITKICEMLIWKPYALSKSLEKQGIKGPSYKFLYGSLEEMRNLKIAETDTVLDVNSDDIIRKVLPHYHYWSSLFGKTLLYWHGLEPRLVISDPEMAKQVLSNKFGFYVRPETTPSFKKLMGIGLVLVEGHDWVRHRRLLNPAFSMDKLKLMVKKMADCTIEMLDQWKNKSLEAKNQCIKIDISKEFIQLTSDIIAHTAFGSSFVQGQEAFNAQKELQKCCVAASTDIIIPGSQYLPTPSNIKIWKLDRQLRNTLQSIIESRLSSKDSENSDYGDDLLGVMIGASEITCGNKSGDTPKFRINEILENCKTFFFSGHETTSNFFTWLVFVLSVHQDWQEKLREEVLKECGMEIPDADMFPKLKLMNMVVLETLRLYGPVINFLRKPIEDTKLGDLMISKDICVEIPIVNIHRSKEYWGEDANEFNPIRFENGILKAAKHPNAFLGFGLGPRLCIGQNFALLEAKTVLVTILQRFSLSLSPDYKHAPISYITLHPQHGLPIILKPLSI